MKKVIDFLEKNVQWVAVGIGGLILLAMLAENLPGLAQPVKVQLLNRDVGPGEIDTAIESEVANPLDRKMKEDVVITTFKVPAYRAKFVERLTKAPKLAYLPLWMFDRNLALITEDFGTIDPNAPTNLAELPKLPPVVLVQTYSLQTHILEILAQPEVAPNNGENVAPPEQPPVAPDAPAAPQAVNVPAAPKQLAPAHDATVVRVQFKMTMADVTRSFLLAKIPDPQQVTLALKVELIRERAMPGGEWSEQTTIGSLVSNRPPENIKFPEGPAKLNALQPVNDYLRWAADNQIRILQPGFPAFEGDDPLGIAPPVLVNAGYDPKNFDPATFKGDPNKLPPDLRKKFFDYKRQKAKEQADRRRNEGGRGKPPPGPQSSNWPPFEPPFAPPVDSLMPAPQQGDVVLFQSVPPGEQPPVDSSDPSMANPDTMTPTQITADPPPSGMFKPNATPDINCWAFDDTAQPGETYRYRVRYYLLNPLFNTGNVAKNPEDETKVWIANDDQNWSNAITTPPLTHVFLAAAPTSTNSAKFVIFHWQDGKRHKFTTTFKPGDTIGGMQNGISFISDWTLADIRASAGLNPKNLVTLVSPSGTIEVRDFDTDQIDPLYVKFDAEVTAANAQPPAQPNQPAAAAR